MGNRLIVKKESSTGFNKELLDPKTNQTFTPTQSKKEIEKGKYHD